MALDRVRLGIVGACGRGANFRHAIAGIPGMEVAAVCDLDAVGMKKAARELGASKSFTEYERMLEKGGVDAVIVGTPMALHVPMAVMALERGVHVLSEVPAGVSLEECQRLVLACRKSSAIYMMAENYIYTRPNMLVTELVRRGMFGTPYFAEGEYIHELKALNEETKWRRKWQTGINGVTYGTHSLGPILQWMAGDRVVSVCCCGSGHHYKDPRGEVYENEDSVVMLCRMASGGLVKIRVDMLSHRPHAMTNYQLQGTEGCYESARAEGEVDRIWLRGRGGDVNTWEKLVDLEEEFLPREVHDGWRVAAEAGHGGGDYFEMVDFVGALRGERPVRVAIDAAMDMTLPGLVSQRSIEAGGRWMGVPDSRLWVSDETLTRGSLHMLWPKERLGKMVEVRVPEGYRMRQYEPPDEGQYAALMEKAGFGVWDHARVQGTFESTLSGGMFVVEHVASGSLVATTLALHNPTALHPHGGELGWVAADPAHRGKGLGTATCAAVMNLFMSRGYERIYLMTDDFRLPAIRVYLRLGFEATLYTAEMEERWGKVQEKLSAETA